MKTPIKATKNKVTFSVRMTPLIDVIFLLLIFFILAIRLEKPEGVLENILPVSDGQSIAEQQKDWEVVKLRVKLITEGEQLKIYLQERVVYTYKDLLSYLNMLPQEIMLVIEPESKVPYKYVIGVYNTCIKAKKSNIVFAISPG
ncbi:MAG: biopolymer transporter ExbD [Deltaproteobacteria bacterium]|nr:biopolymer transporter ExbD [Deltaproteobacteria bacterium]